MYYILATLIIMGCGFAFWFWIWSQCDKVKPPDGWFIQDMIIFNELDNRGFAAKGYIIEPPDMRFASEAEKNGFCDRISKLLSTFNGDIRVQFHWSVDANYKKELTRYDHETETYRALDKLCDLSYFFRKQVFNRFWYLMENRNLRREYLKLYIAIPIKSEVPQGLTGKKLTSAYRDCLSNLSNFFESQEMMINSVLGADMCKIRPMKDADHYAHYMEFLNPNIVERFDYDMMKGFDGRRSIQSNCYHSEILQGEPGKEKGFGFYMDGFFHNVLIIKKWPEDGYPGIMDRLTNCGVMNYEITVNMIPRDIRDEIRKTDKKINRLEGDMLGERKRSLETDIKKEAQKAANLKSGYIFPYEVLMVIRVWAGSRDELLTRTSNVKAAINSMGQAQYWEISRPETARKVFCQTWPGWLFGGLSQFYKYVENDFMATFIPFSSTFTGNADKAECLYDGAMRNITGLTTNMGGTPQHGTLFGASGMGKSVVMSNLLYQISMYYEFICIIEEGSSYDFFTMAHGCRPIKIRPDGRMTFNYLETQGLPLTNGQMKAAAAIVSKMCGDLADEGRKMVRISQITEYVNRVYTNAYKDWKELNGEKIKDVGRWWRAVTDYLEEEMSDDDDFIDAWTEFRDLIKGEYPDFMDESEGKLAAEKARERFANVTETEITEAIMMDEEHNNIRNSAFAWFENDDYPTHSDLVDLLQDPLEEHNAEQIKEIYTLARQYCSDTLNGVLFDGPTKGVDLRAKVAHFELGKMTDTDTMKPLMGFVIQNHTRNYIMTLPRSRRKCYIFEEAGKILAVPGGEQIISEGYAQMRKFNCWIMSIVQQYEMFRQSPIKNVVMSNSRLNLIMRQFMEDDLEEIGNAKRLPRVVRQEIMRYQSPEHMPANERCSKMCYCHEDGDRRKIGTLVYYASHEMLYVSSTTGEDFERRVRDLRKTMKGDKSLVDVVIELANKKEAPKNIEKVEAA